MDSLFSSISSQPFGRSNFFNPLINKHNEDKLFNSSLSVLESKLYSSFQKMSGRQVIEPAAKTDSSDFSPQKIAERIVSFVSDTLDTRASSDLERQSLLAQAREGIEQGINEARDILFSTGNLSDAADEKIDQTRQLIFKGLDELASTQNSVTPDNNNQNQINNTNTEAAIFSASSQSSRQASIQIETQDGDLVTIEGSSFSSSSFSQANITTDTHNMTAYQKSSEYNFEFKYSIEGNLDQGERDAIDDLLKDVNKVAKRFFNGNIQSAFNKALDLDIDGKQLAAFSLDLDYSRRTEVIASYQTIENIAAQQTDLETEPVANLSDAVNYAEEVSDVISKPPAEVPFNEPQIASANLYSLIIEQQLELINEVRTDSVNLLKQFLEQL